MCLIRSVIPVTWEPTPGEPEARVRGACGGSLAALGCPDQGAWQWGNAFCETSRPTNPWRGEASSARPLARASGSQPLFPGRSFVMANRPASWSMLALLAGPSLVLAGGDPQATVVRSEFLFETAPFAQC